MLVLSVTEDPEPCDLCLALSFMGSEKNWTVSIALKVIVRSIIHLRTQRIIESHASKLETCNHQLGVLPWCTKLNVFWVFS